MRMVHITNMKDMHNVLYFPVRASERIANGRWAMNEKKEKALEMLVAVT